MTPESEDNLRLEIGHVLFIDLVGYSKLLIEEQKQRLRQLTYIVLATSQVAKSTNEQLVRLPTGDGMALVFRNSSEEPAQCALEIAQVLKKHPEVQVRMGIHSGPVSEVTDVSGRANIAGAGINIAQRVMDCGDAGHILLSQRVAEDLTQYREWSARLHDLGECEVKHGVRLGVVNLYRDGAGNPQLPGRLKALKQRRNQIRWAGITAAFLLLAAILVAFLFILRKPAPSTSVVPEKSIAVLPFENLSDDKQNAYFAEGIQDEILTRLSKVADLKVISRTSTRRFKSAPEDLPEIAKRLGVANILEGSVQKSNDQVRVNVQLINAATAGHLWADTYDRKLIDLFAVESEIATTIADTLQARLTGPEKRAIAARPTENPDAYQLYLQGRFFWNKRTAADLRKSIEYFQQAIEKDPNYALAYAAAAQAWVVLPNFYGGTPQECFQKAEAAAKRALALDNSLADAHTALGAVKQLHDFDFPGAIAEFERAIQLNPNDATAHNWLGLHSLSASGQVERATSVMKRGLELDPLSLVINTDLGWVYLQAHRFDEAIAQLRRTVEMDGGFYFSRYTLGLALEAKGSLPEAMAEYQKAIALNDDPIPKAYLAHLYGTMGRRDEAQHILAQLLPAREQHYFDAYGLAIVYLGLGDRNEALNWLEQGYRDRNGFNMVSVRVDPLLAPLHGDPRFEALAEKIIPMREFTPLATASK